MSAIEFHADVWGLIAAVALCAVLAAALVWGLRGPGLERDEPPSEGPGPEPRILLPITERTPSARAIELAGHLIGSQEGSMILLCVVEVPWTLPLLAGRRELRACAYRASEAARAIEERYGVIARVRLALERTAADVILRVAGEEEADAVVMSIEAGSRWRRRRVVATARRVLESASCEVIVDGAPKLPKFPPLDIDAEGKP